jgi:hypothetical protein
MLPEMWVSGGTIMARDRRDTYVLMISLFPALIVGNVAGLRTNSPFMMVIVTCVVLMILYLLIDRIYPKSNTRKSEDT